VKREGELGRVNAAWLAHDPDWRGDDICAPQSKANYSVDGIETLHDTEERMAKRFGLLAAVALVSGLLAACTSPTAPAATSQAHHPVPQSSAGVLSGSDT
jgi:hypothetical protein